MNTESTNNLKPQTIFSKGWPHDEAGRPAPQFWLWLKEFLSGNNVTARKISEAWQNKKYVNPYIDDFDRVDQDVVDRLQLRPPVFDSPAHVTSMLKVYKMSELRDTKPVRISYFLTEPFFDGAARHDQNYGQYEKGRDYGTDLMSYQEIQNGTVNAPRPEFCSFGKLTDSYRALATFVHNDCMSQYRHAHQILAQVGAAKNPGMVTEGEISFIINGDAENAGLVGQGIRALKAAWLVKWPHFFIRPETYAGLSVQDPSAVPNLTAAIDSKIDNEDDHGRGRLLPLAFPEGSPTHSEYVPGHSALSGYQATIIKARWDENFILPNGQTIRSEADQLAEDIGIGRVWAGVHYDFSHRDGLRLGEAVAIKVLTEALQNVKIKCHLRFTKFDGTTVVLNNM